MRSGTLLVSLSFAISLSTLTLACSSGGPSTSAPPPAADGGSGSPEKTTSGGKLGAIFGKGPSTPKPDAGAPADPTPAPSPRPETRTCKSSALCLGDCPDENNDACVEACLTDLEGGELENLKAVAQCIDGSACADDDCIQETCASEIRACIGE